MKKRLEEIEQVVGTNCGECGKTYCEHDLDGARAARKSDLRDMIVDMQARKTALEELGRRAASALQALEEHRASMTDLSVTHASLSTWRAQQEVINNAKRELTKIQGELKARHDAHKALEAASDPYLPLLTTASDKIDVQAEVIKSRQTERDDRATEVRVLEEVAVVYGPAGVRAHILDTVTPYLNERTAHYLGTLSDGNISAVWTTLSKTAKGEFREKFTIDVVNEMGAKVFAGLSGGEKRKVRLATALALQDLVASRASKPLELWIGDEIDTALDAAGLERLTGVLELKARERGTVVVISHQDLKDWIREVVTVTKSGGVSIVTGPICGVTA
jgi:DNA repair exonuclease SbcCD ATPase subunit